MRIHSTASSTVMLVAALVLLLNQHSLIAGGANPAKLDASAIVHRSSDTTGVGNLDWEIIECTSGTIIDRGTSSILLNDIAVVEHKYGIDKRLNLGQGFYLKLDFNGNRDAGSGFAVNAARNGEETFSWEWFDQDGKGGAKKRQEGGTLEVGVEKNGSKWDMTSTRFVSDISIRVMPSPSLLTVLSKSVKYRVKIRQGSMIRWPSLVNGKIELLAIPTGN